jgi:hypothetical protein
MLEIQLSFYFHPNHDTLFNAEAHLQLEVRRFLKERGYFETSVSLLSPHEEYVLMLRATAGPSPVSVLPSPVCAVAHTANISITMQTC